MPIQTRYRTTPGTPAMRENVFLLSEDTVTWHWSHPSPHSLEQPFFTKVSALKDEFREPAFPYRFKNCTHMTQENEFKFGRKFDVSKDDQSDDQTKGTFTLGSTSFNGWTTTAHSTFAAVAEQNAFEGISFSEIESWFKDPRIPGGITIDRDAIRSISLSCTS